MSNSPQEFLAGSIVPDTGRYLPFNRATRGWQGGLHITDRESYEEQLLNEGSTFPEVPELGVLTRWVRIRD